MSHCAHVACVALVVAAVGCGRGDGDVFRGSANGVADAKQRTRIVLDTVARGLEVPWGLAFAPGGRIFVTERPGRIRVIDHDTLRAEPWATIDVVAEGEAGLMGIAVAPDYSTTRHVFVVATVRASNQLVNRVIRFTDEGVRGVEPTVIVDGIPAATLHAGDAIAFGPDGALYVATGDARQPTLAARYASLAGKILRYARDGTVPHDNPRAGSPVYARGLRNVQGLAWLATGELIATEHGPSGFGNELGRRGNDEVNLIRPGAHYGWPAVAGNAAVAGSERPLVIWNPAIAPSGLTAYRGSEFAEWDGSLFIAALADEQLRRLRLERSGARVRVVSEEVVVWGLGRIRAVAMGPDGRLYFTTSNRDTRGSVRRGDDHVYRVRRRPQ